MVRTICKKMGSYKRTSCRLCNSKYLKKVLPLKPIPTSEQYSNDKNISINQKRYPIDLYQCLECLHIQQLDIVDPSDLWKEYSYFSGNTSNMPTHFLDEYKLIDQSFSGIFKHKRVLDIGSNDGSFLEVFKNKSWKVIGVDPAKAPADDANLKGIKTLIGYFDLSLKDKILDYLGGPPSLVTMYNAFAHIDNIDDVLSNIVEILDNKNPSIFRFEVQYVGALIDNLLIPSIFHEHISHYSLVSLSRFLSKHDFVMIDASTNSIQHGSLVVSSTHKRNIDKFNPSKSLNKLLINESTKANVYLNALSEMDQRIKRRKDCINKILTSMNQNNSIIAGYGAARSASTIISQLEINKYLKFVYDNNEKKHNLYIAGEGIQIRSELFLEEDFPVAIVILAWVHNKVIIEKLRNYISKGGKVISLFPLLEVYSNQGVETIDTN